MIKDVLISIKGIQGIDDQTDTVEFITDGRFGIKDGNYFISYDESGILDKGEEVKTQIHIKGENKVLLKRSGTINSRMLIEKGVRNQAFYSTPIGELTIGILGEEIDFKLNEKGGNIDLKYTIDSDLRLISRNSVNITIKEVKNDVNFSN